MGNWPCLYLMKQKINKVSLYTIHMSVKLPQPPLLDLTHLKEDDKVKIAIHNTQHRFATDAELSGNDTIHQPMFGCTVHINDKKVSHSTFGLPFMRFARDSQPKITYDNQTKFTFNIHYHGLNTVGSVDGTAMEMVFGQQTL